MNKENAQRETRALGQILKDRRELLGITLPELRRQGLHPNTIKAIEDGKNTAIQSVIRYAQLLGYEMGLFDNNTNTVQ